MLYNDNVDRKRPENKALELTLLFHFCNLSTNPVEREAAMLRNAAVDMELIKVGIKIVLELDSKKKVNEYVR